MYKNSVKKSINFSAENLHLYHYAGNNPIRYVDPAGMFNTSQFLWATIQTFGGIVEVSAGILTEGVTAGVSTYAVIDGIYNIADGIIGITAAVCDKKYDGAISEIVATIAKRTGATKEQQEAISAAAGLADAIIDAKATAGLSLIAKGKTANAIVKGAKVIDKINDSTGKMSLGNQVKNTVKEGFDVIKEKKLNTSKEEIE